MKTEFRIRYLAYLLIVAASVNSMQAIAEDMIPFKAIMQSASAEPAMQPKPDAKEGDIQSTASKHANRGKTERVAGGILLGTGIAVITTTLAVVTATHGSAGHPGRVWAGIGGGAGMTGAGVTVIVVGNHKRSLN